MRIFVPIESVPANERDASEAAWLVPYRCGLPFALDVDPARGDETAQRLIVISSPGERPIARD